MGSDFIVIGRPITGAKDMRETAKRIIEELRKAESMGKGAASLDGRMIDAASEKMANNVLVLAEAIAAKG
jgi:citrate lyase beta subunit